MAKPYNRPLSQAQRQAAMAKIHMGKAQLGLADAAYREMLQNVAGVKSSKDLDQAGFDAVIKNLQGLGAEFTSHKRAGKKPHNLDSQAAKAKQMKKIEALLADMKLGWEYAAPIAKQMYKKEALEFCSGAELRGITTALVMRQRKQDKEPPCT